MTGVNQQKRNPAGSSSYNSSSSSGPYLSNDQKESLDQWYSKVKEISNNTSFPVAKMPEKFKLDMAKAANKLIEEYKKINGENTESAKIVPGWNNISTIEDKNKAAVVARALENRPQLASLLIDPATLSPYSITTQYDLLRKTECVSCPTGSDNPRLLDEALIANLQYANLTKLQSTFATLYGKTYSNSVMEYQRGIQSKLQGARDELEQRDTDNRQQLVKRHIEARDAANNRESIAPLSNNERRTIARARSIAAEIEKEAGVKVAAQRAEFERKTKGFYPSLPHSTPVRATTVLPADQTIPVRKPIVSPERAMLLRAEVLKEREIPKTTVAVLDSKQWAARDHGTMQHVRQLEISLDNKVVFKSSLPWMKENETVNLSKEVSIRRKETQNSNRFEYELVLHTAGSYSISGANASGLNIGKQKFDIVGQKAEIERKADLLPPQLAQVDTTTKSSKVATKLPLAKAVEPKAASIELRTQSSTPEANFEVTQTAPAKKQIVSPERAMMLRAEVLKEREVPQTVVAVLDSKQWATRDHGTTQYVRQLEISLDNKEVFKGPLPWMKENETINLSSDVSIRRKETQNQSHFEYELILHAAGRYSIGGANASGINIGKNKFNVSENKVEQEIDPRTKTKQDLVELNKMLSYLNSQKHFLSHDDAQKWHTYIDGQKKIINSLKNGEGVELAQLEDVLKNTKKNLTTINKHLETCANKASAQGFSCSSVKTYDQYGRECPPLLEIKSQMNNVNMIESSGAYVTQQQTFDQYSRVEMRSYVSPQVSGGWIRYNQNLILYTHQIDFQGV